jgi:hypothetical protein
MLHLLDEGLETFLRASVPLPSRQVDVSFDAPDSEWGSGITKPTVNLYLWDVRLNETERHSGMELVREADGTMSRRRPPLRVDCRYLVTAWTSDVSDEHRLLGAVLAALLQHPVMAQEHLPEPYRAVRPLPTLAVASPNGEETADVWSALGGQLKPGLDLVVTATMDFALAYEAGPPVERYEVGLTDFTTPERRSRVRAVGGRADGAGNVRVRSPRAATTTDAEGRFLVQAEEGDRIKVEGDPPLVGEVSAVGRVPLHKEARAPRKPTPD